MAKIHTITCLAVDGKQTRASYGVYINIPLLCKIHSMGYDQLCRIIYSDNSHVFSEMESLIIVDRLLDFNFSQDKIGVAIERLGFLKRGIIIRCWYCGSKNVGRVVRAFETGAACCTCETELDTQSQFLLSYTWR